MECFKIENLSFKYPDRTKRALSDISFSIAQGEFVLLCGKSGCGKTTLLRLLKPSLSPYGEMEGTIFFDGKNIAEYEERNQAAEIGFVMQNPENQIVTDKVWHEMAFGLESLGVKQNEIRARVSEMASFFGIQGWFYKKVTMLSGGQKQLLNLASVMVMNPSVLILDEPTSQLDPIAAGEFLKTLEKINRELGTTIILTEHRLEDAFPMADRVIVMDEGVIISDNAPKETAGILKEKNHDMYKALPTPMRVCGEITNSLSVPLTVREGRIWLEEYAHENALFPERIQSDTLKSTDAVIEVEDAYFRYEKEMHDAVKGLNLSVCEGELFALAGGNGSGKTTALSLISGLNRPYRGKVKIKGQNISKIKNLYDGLVGVLPQNPQSVFVKKSVYLDLLEGLSDKKLSAEEKEERVERISKLCEIESLLKYHPYDLSGGEAQRVALAKILLTEPKILLLDEPTKGMDASFKEEFAHILSDLKDAGVTILMVSHDIEFCAEYADRCALMFDGGITSSGTPREFFRGKNFYTTAANRMARKHLPDAVLPDDIILGCGGEVKPKEKKKKDEKTYNGPKEDRARKEDSDITPKKKKGKKLSKGTLAISLLMLLLIPLTIWAGISFLGDRKYYFISLLIILETMIPFCMVFEAGKPKAREIVLVSVLCAIAVIGRMAFFMLPEFKPVVAIVIISGACLGAQTGFLVGAVTGFVSNFFFGQGPWTPWQMFAFGMIGFVSGILFQKGFLKKAKVSLCVFGFLAAFIIYGGIVNISSITMVQSKITWEIVLAAYTAAVPFDLIHALSTVFFLWFISEAMTEKLERIKKKFGLFEEFI